MANVGQEEDFEEAKAKALHCGASKVFIEDLRKDLVEEFVFPAIQCNAQYEGVYLLGTSLARPIIARRQIEIAEREDCFAVSHGCTGKGNDQVRLELAYYALKPSIKVLAPWRQPEFYNRFSGRQALLDYAEKKGIPVSQTVSRPWSIDENLFHCSYEAGILEDPNTTPPKNMWKLCVDPIDAPDIPEYFTITFKKGLPVMLESGDRTEVDSLKLYIFMNDIARRNGIGRIDIIENRFIGIKSRGCYESPALTCFRIAHIDLEGLVLDRQVRALRDQFITPNYSKILYNGMYFSPEREFLSEAIVSSQKTVNGSVRCRAYKGQVSIIGSFEPSASSGFIEIESIRLKKYGQIKYNSN